MFVYFDEEEGRFVGDGKRGLFNSFLTALLAAESYRLRKEPGMQ